MDDNEIYCITSNIRANDRDEILLTVKKAAARFNLRATAPTRFYSYMLLRFTVATEHMNQFVLDDFLDVSTSRAEVFARVEGCRMSRHVFADTCG